MKVIQRKSFWGGGIKCLLISYHVIFKWHIAAWIGNDFCSLMLHFFVHSIANENYFIFFNNKYRYNAETIITVWIVSYLKQAII